MPLTAKVQDMVNGVGYKLYPPTNPTKPNGNWTERPSKLLDGKPLIQTSVKPGEIMALALKITPDKMKTLHTHPTYQALAGHLAKYYKGKLPWDEFGKVIPDEMRDLLQRIEMELKRHGYFICGSDYRDGQARIRYAQVTDVEHTKPIPEPLIPDLCTLCERDCPRKDYNGVMRNGARRCWQ